ncbi:hypothetical protein GCM10018793_15380 [Streptomyces sulfonofaciens]|uniref:NlpC/P60 domain-containing protein n=1 Tax=Streptomyces sulfonofaciens TaxID=68272 RepID=A0A919KW05_9ACTN|nr:C40 family peptidase [Streptomyces sulfonofaciens]GHH74364.1 hypothetical protein GCM10018793_15380 [Streptomyces sulfonofaciens]
MGSHRRIPGPGAGRGTRVTVLSAATATAAAALAAVPADAAPTERHTDARAEVDRLYRQAERATEAYHRTTEQTHRLTARVSSAQDRLAHGQQRVNEIRDALGSIAGAQYRTGGVDPALRLFLSSRPDEFLDTATTLDRIGTRTASRLKELETLRRGLAQDRAEAERTLRELEHSRRVAARHKRTVEHKLAEARRLLRTLTAAQRAVFGHSSPPGRFPAAGPGAPPATQRAAAALAAARSALGRPYVWGANGPAGFDCSGLTQWAYAQAGVGLPRTSQAQRYAGRRVPPAQARPGDLVAYRQDASHIAMYAGHGQVIHAPYPGAPVRYDPVGMMPVSSVTRI